ncbi:MurR/RpiR family transcriptional regulator [Affinibrenneria salicis]|uniref:MurR/RpiR family transcriptional regulator n=2 Tax=Affinibrenneria salicis TaxID=2590031 RepID=A0A5J5FVT5_9GAMM|nr:MurR/RpiR family transcriptional regulator [Affinibrenneria salicis]
MTILTKISAALTDMTPVEQQIARFVLEHPVQVCQLTSIELASLVGASQSGIIKFSKKQGLAGFSQLKLAINEAVVKRDAAGSSVLHGNIQSGDSLHDVSMKLIGGKFHCLRETLELNKESSFIQVLDALDGARRIHLAGIGASSLVARDFSYKLLKLGRVALHDSDSHVQIANASAMSPQDVLLALSHSGGSRETVQIARVAKGRGAKIISMTRAADNALAQLADLRLYTVADEEKVRVSSITARDAQLLLIDLLFIQMAQRQPDAGDYVHNSQAAVDQLKS